LSVEEKLVVQQIEYVKNKADMSRKFRLLPSIIEMVCENETTIIMLLNRTDREERFESRNSATMRRRLCG